MKVCDGIDPNYLMKHGAGEFQKYDGPSRGMLLDRERLAYPGVFKIKAAPWARMDGIVGNNREIKDIVA